MKHSLEELERLASEATPGPWEWREHGSDEEIFSITTGARVHHDTSYYPSGLTTEDAKFIAAAREAVPDLIQRVRELETRCAVLLERATLAEGEIAGVEKRDA